MTEDTPETPAVDTDESHESHEGEDAPNSSPNSVNVEHIVDSPIDSNEIENATDEELEAMIETCHRTLDLIDHKLNGDGRLRDVEKEKVRCSYIRAQMKTLKQLSELREQREIAEMRARLEHLERETDSSQDTIEVEEVR